MNDNVLTEDELSKLEALIQDANSHAVIASHRALCAERDTLRKEVARLLCLIDTPHTDDFMAAVPLEAAHQVKRWGVEHDAGKTSWDWFWLIGYLAQKAASSALAGDTEKAKHHTISTSAVLLNWFRHLVGDERTFQPGVDPTSRGIPAITETEQ